MNTLSQLKKTPLCKNIDEAQLAGLFDQGIFILQHYPGDSFIFRAGESPQRLYLLLSGQVEICRDTLSGRRLLLTTLSKPGDVFGEIYLFIDRDTYDMYARAAKPTQVVAISRHFLSLEHQSPLGAAVQSNLLSLFAQKAYGMRRRLDILAGGSLREKIARFLAGKQTQNAPIILDMTRESLADYLGVTRPSLSRELSLMQKDGIIASKGREIRIIDQAALDALL